MKISQTELTVPDSSFALFGGEPAFHDALHVGRPNIPGREKFLERVSTALDARLLTNDGPLVREFENKLSEKLEVGHCIALSSGSAALILALHGLEPGSEVVLPSMTFPATAHAVSWMGLQPVFCDIDQKSRTMDPAEAEKLITGKTSAMLPVHVWGRSCQVDRLEELACAAGIRLIYDAAHTLGCTRKGKPLAAFGDMSVLSFHATKIINSWEGGAILTDDDDRASMLRQLRNHGIGAQGRVEMIGLNAKMSEVHAAMGLGGLESLDDFIGINRDNFAAYREGLEGVPGIRLLEPLEPLGHNYHYVVIEVEPTAGLDRDVLEQVLQAENVLVRRYFWPGCHRLAPYLGGTGALVRTEKLLERVLCLPTGSTIGHREIDTVCDIIRKAQHHAGAISRRLRGACLQS